MPLPRWVAPSCLALVTVAASALAVVAPSPRRASAPAGGTAKAAVVSARRVPALVSRVIADTRLRAGLLRVLDDAALGGARRRSCLVVAQHGRRILEVRPSEALIPASNVKLLTAVAALQVLGPDARFVTEARLAGDTLWLVGGGDPLLSTADYLDWQRRALPERAAGVVGTPLEALADGVRAAGVTSVVGGVRGDESRYDDQRYLPTWKPGYRETAQVGPQSALVVNDGFVEFAARRVPAPSPAKHAADVLASLLQARGVAVTGGTGEGRVPPGAQTVARVESPPLGEVVAEMLRESDNLTAELLVKELAARRGAPGTTATGVAAVRDALAAAGLPVAGIAVVDGSGLDRANRATCTLLFAAVAQLGPESVLAAGLPVAGQQGTLADRFDGNPAAGRLRAKTGALDGVTGLTGFVVPRAGAPLVFSLLANELPREATGRALQEAIGAALARYPEAPDPEALAP